MSDDGELRERLIEAMRYQYQGHDGAYERMLDAVLTKIADEISAHAHPLPDYYGIGLAEAAALLRRARSRSSS